MKKRLLVIALVIIGIFTSFLQVHAQSIEKNIEIPSFMLNNSSNRSFENGTYNTRLSRMEYIVEAPFYGMPAFSSEGIEILRTVYAYYTLGNQKHQVDVIHVKRHGNETWEETIKTYNESHSFYKEYTANYYRSGEYGYYPYDHLCSKCKHRQGGGVDKIYIGIGHEMPVPNANDNNLKEEK